MGILHMFLGWFFHLKAIKKSKHFYWAPHNTQSVSSLTSCLPCPLGPQVQVAAGRTWMERDGGWARDLMRPMLEKKRKGMAGPRKSLTLGEAVFLHSVTITPNIPQGNCPQPLTCHLPGKIDPLLRAHNRKWVYCIKRRDTYFQIAFQRYYMNFHSSGSILVVNPEYQYWLILPA